MAWGKTPLPEAETGPPGQLLAAEYVRMSTEHQQYSTRNRALAIRDYAERRGIKLIEGTLGPDHLRLVVAGRYVERLLMNERINRYLAKNHGDILGEFGRIVAGLSRPETSEGAGVAEG